MKYRAFELYSGKGDNYEKYAVVRTREEAMLRQLNAKAWLHVHEHTLETKGELEDVLEEWGMSDDDAKTWEAKDDSKRE